MKNSNLNQDLTTQDVNIEENMENLESWFNDENIPLKQKIEQLVDAIEEEDDLTILSKSDVSYPIEMTGHFSCLKDRDEDFEEFEGLNCIYKIVFMLKKRTDTKTFIYILEDGSFYCHCNWIYCDFLEDGQNFNRFGLEFDIKDDNIYGLYTLLLEFSYLVNEFEKGEKNMKQILDSFYENMLCDAFISESEKNICIPADGCGISYFKIGLLGCHCIEELFSLGEEINEIKAYVMQTKNMKIKNN